jgi:kynurenine 3-monooxygenase
MSDGDRPISIVGAGLTGSVMAMYLARRGYDVEVYDRRPDLREVDIAEGRSINMALSTRGLTALSELDLDEEALSEAIPMYGRLLHETDGERTFQSYGGDDDHINSISRTVLTRLVVDHAARHPNVSMHFRHECEGLDLDGPTPNMRDLERDERLEPASQLVVGADGAYSAIRERIMKSGRFDYQQEYLSHGYKELSIPAAPDGGWRFETKALHIWPRHDFMFIALPNPDGSFTGTLFLPFEGRSASFEAIEDGAEARHFFDEHFPDASAAMPDLEEEFEAHPTGPMVTVRCKPFHHESGVLLAGDAAHTIVPFYGQGMNACFEDCFIVDQLADAFDDDWSKILPAFTQRRKPDADAIADLALYNYLEMRSRVADPTFRARKAIESKLHRLFPQNWRPLYSMVTFSTMPYAEALERAEGQKDLLDALLPETVFQVGSAITDRLGR